jgi:hypothetical protein
MSILYSVLYLKTMMMITERASEHGGIVVPQSSIVVARNQLARSRMHIAKHTRYSILMIIYYLLQYTVPV